MDLSSQSPVNQNESTSVSKPVFLDNKVDHSQPPIIIGPTPVKSNSTYVQSIEQGELANQERGNPVKPSSVISPPIKPSSSVKIPQRIVSVEGLINSVGSSGERHPTNIRFYPRTPFKIEDNRFQDFWVGYCQLAENEITNQNLTLGESIVPTNIPVINDIRLEFYDEFDHLDDNQFIYALTHIYQQAISRVINLSSRRLELVAVILKSDRVELTNGHVCYSYRIQFPYCRVSMDFLDKILKPMILSEFGECLTRLNAKPIGSKDAMIRSSFIDGYLPLYMSKARSSHPIFKYFVTLGNVELLSIEEPSDEIHLKLEEYLPLEYHTHVTRGILNIDTLPDDFEPTHWLPLILSVNYQSKLAVVAPGVMESRVVRPETLSSDSPDLDDVSLSENEDDEDDEDPVWIARQLLPYLSSKRFSNEHYWMSIGEALYNITDGSDDGLKWWIRQSLVGDKYRSSDCEKVWMKWCGSSDLKYSTVRTIAYFARQDQPEKYNSWLDDWCESALTKATSIVHTDVSRAFYRIYWLDYTCSSITRGGRWYSFEKNHWKETNGAHKIRRILSRDFVKNFERMRTRTSRKIENMAGEGHTKSSLELFITKIGKLIAKLGNVTFKNNIVKELAEYFYDERFDTLKDNNPRIMGVYNGVIETTSNKAIFRSGKPEDYLTMFSCVRYDPNLSEKSQTVRFIYNWLSQTFIDKSLIQMFLLLNASRLRSGNPDKKFIIYSGKDGNNSKSMWKKMTEQTFGPYSTTLSEAILTEKPTARGASPELTRVAGTKIAWITEPDEDDPIRNGTLKKMTGGDSFFARRLHENGDGDITMTYMLFMMCNRIPPIPKSEKTIIERLMVIPFLSCWTRDAPDDPAEQFRTRTFKRDGTFEDKIPCLTSAFLWILVQKYAEYCKYGLSEPEVVKKYTNQYWEETDVYNMFTKDRIEMVIVPGSISEQHPKGIPDTSVCIDKREVYNLFSNWFQDNMPGLKIALRTTVIDEISRRWGDPSESGVWRGIQAKGSHGGSNIYG